MLDRLGCYTGSELILSGNGLTAGTKIAMKVDAERFELLCRKAAERGLQSAWMPCWRLLPFIRGAFSKLSYQQWTMALDTYYHSKYTLFVLKRLNSCDPSGVTAIS
jgi:hypothetical protein